MAFQIIRNDIINVQADAIVNTANPEVFIGEGVDSAIYKAAGEEELLAARKQIGELAEGTVGVTKAFNLNANYIIHASGPWWDGGERGEKELLRACYDKSLCEASMLGCKSIAFPLLSTGTYGFPREESLRIALDSFSRFLEQKDMEIFLVVFDKESVCASGKLFKGLREYVDENYVEDVLEDEYNGWLPESLKGKNEADEPIDVSSSDSMIEYSVKNLEPCKPHSRRDRFLVSREAQPVLSSRFTEREPKYDLDYYLETAEDPFCQYLQQLINKKGYKNSEVYKKANLTKQYFSKVMNAQVNPTKEKLLSIAIALKLNMDETKDMLMMAGYAMSPCNKVDLVVAYFIRSRNYNMFDIEIALDDLGLPTLSSY